MSLVAAVAIGRNEGDRLRRCLASLDAAGVDRVVYVDSGSTDGSADAARSVGAHVVDLDMTEPFTAARARNAGLAVLGPEHGYVQVIDGDCELAPGWIDVAVAFLDAHPEMAAVTGRLREKAPEASLWNRLADAEWNAPSGEAEAFGGIAFLRRSAIDAVDGYRADLGSGEEPEMCLRLRRAGWRIWRLPDEMAFHDIAMTQFGQWWRRTRRGGHGTAHLAALHGHGPERFRVNETRRALLWGAALPLATLVGLLLSPWASLLLLAWPLQVLRLRSRGMTWERAAFLTLGKVAEAEGALRYHLGLPLPAVKSPASAKPPRN